MDGFAYVPARFPSSDESWNMVLALAVSSHRCRVGMAQEDRSLDDLCASRNIYDRWGSCEDDDPPNLELECEGHAYRADLQF